MIFLWFWYLIVNFIKRFSFHSNYNMKKDASNEYFYFRDICIYVYKWKFFEENTSGRAQHKTTVTTQPDFNDFSTVINKAEEFPVSFFLFFRSVCWQSVQLSVSFFFHLASFFFWFDVSMISNLVYIRYLALETSAFGLAPSAFLFWWNRNYNLPPPPQLVLYLGFTKYLCIF